MEVGYQKSLKKKALLHLFTVTCLVTHKEAIATATDCRKGTKCELHYLKTEQLNGFFWLENWWGLATLLLSLFSTTANQPTNSDEDFSIMTTTTCAEREGGQKISLYHFFHNWRNRRFNELCKSRGKSLATTCP